MASLAIRSAIPVLRSGVHNSASLSRTARGFAHAVEYNNMPFDYSNRRKFAVKCIAYMGFGFVLPFVAVGWQWYKPGGYKNS